LPQSPPDNPRPSEPKPDDPYHDKEADLEIE